MNFVGGALEKRNAGGPAHLEQAGDPGDVGGQQVGGGFRPAIGIGFDGEVEDAGHLVLGEQAGHEGAVRDVALDELIAGIVIGPDQVAGARSGSKLVENDEALQ